jgi:SAM-dependent methyltransferase
MTKYTETIYPEDTKNQYPQRLSKYICDRFFSNSPNEIPKILDIGCCTGKALKCFAENQKLDLYGIDLRDESIEGINFKECNLEKERIPFPDNYFDFIYSKSVLEHVFNTNNFLSESLRVLKPGGVFVALTPDWKSQQNIFWDDYTHVKPFTRKGLRDSLTIHGFEEGNCEYFYQLPFMWKYPWLWPVPTIVSLLPDFLKWKDREQRNTRDRKLIRFSKEKMLLAYGRKP